MVTQKAAMDVRGLAVVFGRHNESFRYEIEHLK
jgi:hypothetical protein